MTTYATPAPSGLDALRHRLSTTDHSRPSAPQDVLESALPDHSRMGPDEIQQCHGFWSGPDPKHTQHAPCLNPAEWAGLSDHDHAKTTLRCTAHRTIIDIAVRDNWMFCLTCDGHIRSMTWQPV